MQQSFRRVVCRLAFLGLCVVPTLGTLAWGITQRLPTVQAARHASWESRLTNQLGLEVTIDSVTSGRSGTVLEGVRVVDPESRQLLAKIRLAEVHWTDGRYKVHASQPEIQATALPRLVEALHSRLLRSGQIWPQTVTAQGLTIRDKNHPITLNDVQWKLDALQQGPEAAFTFRLADEPMEELATFRVSRNRSQQPPQTSWVFHTAGAEIPCGPFTAYFPQLRPLGPTARFRGSVWASQGPSGWTGDASGELLDVDLDRLVSDRFPHKLSGLAAVRLTVARVEQGRLAEAAGELHSPSGVVSRSLLAAAQQWLELSINRSAVDLTQDQRLEYRELAIGFRIDPNGLSIAALPDAPQPGVLMSGRNNWLLGDVSVQPVPVVSLVHMLVPQNDVQVPATQQTRTLVSLLPLPAIESTGNRQRRLVTPLRIGRDSDRSEGDND